MLKRLVIAFAAMAALVLLAATPAQAVFDTNCPNGTGCVYTDPNGWGIRYIISVGNSGVNTCHNLPGALDNKATSSHTPTSASGLAANQAIRSRNCRSSRSTIRFPFISTAKK